MEITGSKSRRIIPSSLTSCLIAFILYLILDHFIQSALPTSYQSKQALLSAPGAADAVVLGSSHALYDIVASRLGKDSVSLANTSQSIFIDEQILSKYLETHRAPRLVIEPISYFSMKYMLTKSPEEWRDCWYSVYMHTSERSIFERVSDRRYWGMPCLLGAAKLFHVAEGILSDFPTASLDSSGSINSDKDVATAAINDFAGHDRVQYHDQIMTVDASLNRKSLEHMAQLCRAHGTQLVFVTLPVYRTYSKFMNMQKFRSDVQMVKSIPNTKYIDLLDSPSFTLADFRDNDHLNRRGASKLTDLLKERCDQVLAMKPDFSGKSE